MALDVPTVCGKLVVELAASRCEYCRCRNLYSTSTSRITLSRVSMVGTDESNLALACLRCNGTKVPTWVVRSLRVCWCPFSITAPGMGRLTCMGGARIRLSRRKAA